MPVGFYYCTAFIGDTQPGGGSGAYVATPRPVEVRKGELVKIKVGGPIHYHVPPEAGPIKIMRGSSQEVEMTVYAGKDIVHFVEPGTWTAVITDSKGKTVAEENVGNSRSLIRCTQVFTIPGNLKPGTYTVDIKLDARPYQQPLRVKKKLIVK